MNATTRRWSLLALLATAAAAAAGCGTHTALGGGIGAMRYSEEGGAGTSSAGPMLALRLGVPDSGFRGMLAADLKLFGTKDPGTNASMRSLILLPSFQATGQDGVSLRFGLGPVLSRWSGDPAVDGLSVAPIAGAALSFDRRRSGRQTWSVELFGAGAVAPDVAALLGGVHVLHYIR